MGYCGAETNTWTSAYTYIAMVNALPRSVEPTSGAHLALTTSQTGGQSFYVGGGFISPTTFELNQGFYHTNLAVDTKDDLPDGPYTVEILNANGTILYSRNFGVIQLSNHDPGAQEIVFKTGDSVLGKVTASPGKPEVHLLSPNGGENWATSGTETITWQASDPDGDTLMFNLQISRDGGQTWQAIAINLSGVNSYQVETTNIPGGNILMRIMATDGFNTAEDQSDTTFKVANKGPKIHIGSPENNTVYSTGELVVFRGFAADLEDAKVNNSAYIWSSDRDGVLGNGSTLWGVPLSAGRHQITLTVSDQDGNTDTESVTIFIGTDETQPVVQPIEPQNLPQSPENPSSKLGLVIVVFACSIMLVIVGLLMLWKAFNLRSAP